MGRTIVPETGFHSEALAPGVLLQRFYPGGKDGPNGEVLFATPGGQVWSGIVMLGDARSPFQMTLPDIRLPANQIWPLHWHDCWTLVVIVEGQCLIGDWWMQTGDVFIAAPSLEYGPLVIGPDGCRMFEIFAQAHLSPGGYAPEYRDHPTLQGTQAVFAERSPVNRRNDGRQSLPCAGVDGVITSRLAPGAQWDLGEPGDPDRGVVIDTRLAPGEGRPPRAYDDWRAILVLDGELQVAGRTLGRDDFLLIEPGGQVPALTGGGRGAQLLELCRTARAL